GDAGRYWCINGDTNETIHDAFLIILRKVKCPETPQRILKGQTLDLKCGTNFWGARDESYFPTVKWIDNGNPVTSKISIETNQSTAIYTYTADDLGASVATCSVSVTHGLLQETELCKIEFQVTDYADNIWVSTNSSTIGSDIYTIKEGFLSNRKPVYTSNRGLYL
ncbi:unnamed protein product, partial [Owenia fusiformis]